jgi:diguanylate cyclase (GGDEF)-like protein/PAS domain S-box-containing protein
MVKRKALPRDRRKYLAPAALTLRDICFVGRARDCAVREVRAAQVKATAALVPLGSAINCINAVLVAIALKAEVAHWQLYCWVGALFAMASARLLATRAVASALRSLSLTLGAISAALLWALPLVYWAPRMGPGDKILTPIALAGMMSGGSVVLATLPPAAVSYIIILAGAAAYLSTSFSEPMLLPLVVAFAVALVWASVRHAVQFANQLNTRLELDEKVKLLGLLREFGSSGSDWLWEVDAENRLSYVSSSFARAMGVVSAEIIGRSVRELLDPTREIAAGCSAMRMLFDHFDHRTPFVDLAIPYRGRWCAISGKPLIDRNGRCTGWRGAGSDITELRLSGGDAIRAARRDPMTGLSNRLLLREELEQALLPASGRRCALMLIDLDRFKLVNDTLGHSVGDELLKAAAKRIDTSVGLWAKAGRIGGDEFAIVWSGAVEPAALAEFAKLMIARLSEPFLIGDNEINIGATVGIAIGPDDGGRQDELTCSADLALYRAKKTQRGSFQFYEPWMGAAARENRVLESDLRAALNSGGLSLAYQPIVRTSDLQVVGHEALLRWSHPERGEIPPSRFVPIIEESGLMTRVGNWVIERACADAACWPDPLPVAINVSAAQLAGSSIAATVAAALAGSGLAPERLEIEVTESIFLGDDQMALAALAELRSLGVRLVLDDFGKGYSAFGYFARAKFSKVKIDREFVHGAAAEECEHLGILEAIMALSRRLGIETTAEGIETYRQEQMMGALGCTYLQGYRFGRPVPAQAIAFVEPDSLRRLA